MMTRVLNRYALCSCVAAAILAGCGGSQPPIGAPGAMAAGTPGASMMQPATMTCATSPPQYRWIFKGACDRQVLLQSTGGNFSLAEYDGIKVRGEIGRNTTRGTATLTIADATDTNGDVANWEGKVFPKHIGKTFLYAVAINQSNQTIKMITVRGTPTLRYVVTDAKGLPGKTCGDALLSMPRHGRPTWVATPAVGHAKGNKVTITEYGAPSGFELPPKWPVYFAVYCHS